jgi:Flp pilus assembly protein TadD
MSLERLSAFLAQDPGNPELACEVFDLHFAAGHFTQARDTFAQLPEHALALAGVRFRTARHDLVTGAYADAETTLRSLAESGHDSAAVAHDIAFAQLCQRNLAAAQITVDAALSRYEATPALHVLHARIALMRKDYPVAHAALDAALRLDADDATALGLRALALLDAGEEARATTAAAECLLRYPDQHEALLAAGTASLWAGDSQSAERHYVRALDRFPNSGRALSGLGQCRMLAGDLEQARVMLDRAIIAMPDHIGTWHALGWMQLLSGELDAAERSYRTALELDRNFAESHGGLAVVALLDERHEEGEGAMKRALKLDPNSITGRYAQSLWLQHTGDQSGATAIFADLMRSGAMPGMSDEEAGVAAQRLRERATAHRGERR